LGATVENFLDKPVANGGLDISCHSASLALAIVILAYMLPLPQRAEAFRSD